MTDLNLKYPANSSYHCVTNSLFHVTTLGLTDHHSMTFLSFQTESWLQEAALLKSTLLQKEV